MTQTVFRTPEEVAPELGMYAKELRRYCRESGIYTKLSNRRVALDKDDEQRIVAWVKARKAAAPPQDWAVEAQQPDPFK